MPSPQLDAAFAAVVLLTLACRIGTALADEPPVSSGNFLSSLKQAVQQDVDQEVVLGHFDIGRPPDSHRYYCLVNEKTGKREEYGVAGELQTRRDGMSAVKGAAVSFYSCSKAAAEGILVTTGYLLRPGIPAASPAKAPAAEVGKGTAAGTVTTVGEVTAAGEVTTAGEAATASEVKAVFAKFVAAENAHDRAALSELLWDSKDLLVTSGDGTATWGRAAALESYQQEWQKNITLTPPLNDVRIANPAPGVAVLVSPLLITRADSASPAATVMTWNGVFVKTHAGWRIMSIFELNPPNSASAHDTG
jgi:ketosteroid isomerase-like protein